MNKLRGALISNASLANYTTWRVGGRAKQLYKPADLADLQVFLTSLPPQEPLLWIGLGSNLLIRDGGFSGTVIITQGALNQIQLIDETTLYLQAGVACGTAARYCARLGLLGIEFLAGVPGTIGGALKMNAGAHGGETWQFVTHADLLQRNGEIHHLPKAQFHIDYRHVVLPNNTWFTGGYFKLTPGDKDISLAKIKSLLAHRSATQPINYPNCGSVFRNPPNHFAAKLIEQCGLKGKRIGGASISLKHANFIINEGNASAQDIEQLILTTIQTVKHQHNIELTREVHIVGEALF